MKDKIELFSKLRFIKLSLNLGKQADQFMGDSDFDAYKGDGDFIKALK